MTDAKHQLEEHLCTHYERQLDDYAHALEHADQLLAASQPNPDVSATLVQIASLMEGVAKNNAALAEPRRQWLQLGQQPGPRLDAALQALTRWIHQLRDRIGALERSMSNYKNQLVPELDRLLRGQQMQRAYAAATPTR